MHLLSNDHFHFNSSNSTFCLSFHHLPFVRLGSSAMLRRVTSNKGSGSPLRRGAPPLLPQRLGGNYGLQSLHSANSSARRLHRGYASSPASEANSTAAAPAATANSKAFGHTLNLPRTTFPLYTTEKAQLQLEGSLLPEVSDNLYAWQVLFATFILCPLARLSSFIHYYLTCDTGATTTPKELRPARWPALRQRAIAHGFVTPSHG
jgi:hypothetical protein